MKDLAVRLFLSVWILFVFIAIVNATTETEWSFRKSPQTGICYEARHSVIIFGWGYAMSQVDDKYCEEAR